jgi:mannose-6-phosphate isomerase-like protein (cupin superfamily)
MMPPLTVVDIQLETQDIKSYKNFPVSLVNDHNVRVSVMTEPFYWHYHPNSDEAFLVLEGILCIDLEDRTVELAPGQLFAISANVRHCTRPKGNRCVSLTFELTDIETIKC